jgi:hypothetical protein
MTCSCPKCHAQIEVDLSNIPESGNFTPCPECKSRFWINKESYARMALNKEGKTYCDKCGKELDRIIVCAACGVMYPDYYLVQASKPPRRQVEKPDLFSMSFTLKPAAKQTYVYTGAKKSVAGPSKAISVKVGLLALVALLVAGLSYFYHVKKNVQLFATNYIWAVYAIKTGTDLSLETCANVSTNWKSTIDAGQKFVPRISDAEESRLNRVKNTADRIMLKLNEPPKKYLNSKEKLANLYEVYSRAHMLAISPSGSLSNYTNSAAKSGSDFKLAAEDLKASLPVELTQKLQKAKERNKYFKDF